MDNLSNAYALYDRADSVLKSINETKNKSTKRSIFKKDAETNLIVRLLDVHGLIEVTGDQKHLLLTLTKKGEEHLRTGGFGYPLLPSPDEVSKKTFKQHLDDLTGLLTIFGILNAVILFASQVKQVTVTDPEILNLNGVHFVSIGMYLISIMVLIEIVWLTLQETQNSIKFQLLYYLLCATTTGMGMLFLSEFFPLIYGLLGIAAFFSVVGGVFWLLLKTLPLIMTKRNAPWFVKYKKGVSLTFLGISMLVAVLILRLVLYLLFKK